MTGLAGRREGGRGKLVSVALMLSVVQAVRALVSLGRRLCDLTAFATVDAGVLRERGLLALGLRSDCWSFSCSELERAEVRKECVGCIGYVLESGSVNKWAVVFKRGSSKEKSLGRQRAALANVRPGRGQSEGGGGDGTRQTRGSTHKGFRWVSAPE